MLQRHQVTFSFSKIFAVLLLPLYLSSCAVITGVTKYPKNTPFVFKTIIKVEGPQKASDKQELETRLQNQLDDSLKVRIISYPLWQNVYKPAKFDTLAVKKSESFMLALLNSQGYFSSTIKDTFWIDTIAKKKQQRVTVSFRVTTGKGLKFDSVGYALDLPAWEELVTQNKNESLLKKNDPYNKYVVGKELDRIIALMRDNGYYKVGKEDIYAEADTVAFGLIDPTLSPLEQAVLIEQLKQKQQNPTVNVVVKQRPPKDSSHTRVYYIDSVTIYSDVPFRQDTSIPVRYDTTRFGKFTIISQTDKFHKKFLVHYSALKPGDIYRQINYFRTISLYNQLGAWQQANVDIFEDSTRDSLLNVRIMLYPAKKYNLILDLETTVNNALGNNPAFVATSNLLGFGVNTGLRNRNFGKESIQSTTNARFGIELGRSFIQTLQVSGSQNFYFPKLIMPGKKKYDSVRTILSLNAAYTDRKDYYKLGSVNLAWGYEITKRTHVWFWRPFNLELSNLQSTDSLNRDLDSNSLLKYAFTDGTVLGFIGGQGVYRWQKVKGSNIHMIRVAAEESGTLLGFIKQLDIQGKLFRFFKTDAQYTYTRQFKSSAFAFRIMGGVGWAYGDSSATVKEKTLPFFKQFFAGGPNSMRAWQVRQLGLGSNKRDTLDKTDRFGDIQFETNLEYRFRIATIAGYAIGSAFYVDIGNVWSHSTYGDPKLTNSDFKFSRMLSDLAVGTGTGLRLDFTYFLIRLDYAFKVKDPNRFIDPDQWFYDWKLFNGQLQLGINYPF
jgi:outer membrane protein assembly factor BamA